MQGYGWHGRLLQSDNDLRLKNIGMYGARFGMLVCSIGKQTLYAYFALLEDLHNCSVYASGAH